MYTTLYLYRKNIILVFNLYVIMHDEIEKITNYCFYNNILLIYFKISMNNCNKHTFYNVVYL